MKVGLINYGVGNLGSVYRALEDLRVSPSIVDRAVDLHAMDCFILPGVGSFKDCSELLIREGWKAAIQDEIHTYNKALLGICLGMQLLATQGDEGCAEGEFSEGLDLIPGQVKHLSKLNCAEKLPHVGWNDVTPCRMESGSNSTLFYQIPAGTDFYFVHSYTLVPNNPTHTIATCNYGNSFAAAVQNSRVWGTQFHPEKSSRAGRQLLKNFLESWSC
jgi:imidazole glycerol-phosphate synthase subunit HisH